MLYLLDNSPSPYVSLLCLFFLLIQAPPPFFCPLCYASHFEAIKWLTVRVDAFQLRQDCASARVWWQGVIVREPENSWQLWALINTLMSPVLICIDAYFALDSASSQEDDRAWNVWRHTAKRLRNDEKVATGTGNSNCILVVSGH